MTLREHYAGLMMAALVGDYLTQAITTPRDDHFTLELAAQTALRAADALIAAIAAQKVESERRP